MTELRALALAPAARAWLAETSTARVLNVFDRACNLVNPLGQVLAVVTSERGLTPFALVVAAGTSAPFRAIQASTIARVSTGQLQLGPLTVDFANARLWDPTPDWASLQRVFADSRWLEPVAALALGRGPAGSLLELLAPPDQNSRLPLAFQKRAQAGALELTAGLRGGSLEQAIAGAAQLAGAGGGLTPAGDDFVLGALLAAWAGLFGPGAEQLAGPVAEAAAARTTTLSAAYLRAAARGECSTYWQALFGALLRPDWAGLEPAVQALLAVGHTSGADALAGFMTAARRPIAEAALSTEDHP